jgi:hypothetical protein
LPLSCLWINEVCGQAEQHSRWRALQMELDRTHIGACAVMADTGVASSHNSNSLV